MGFSDARPATFRDGLHVALLANNGGDFAAQLIMAGLGRDCPQWCGGRYARLETAAATRLPSAARSKPTRMD
ncbi:MAG TPA: hypothetical protein VJ890_21605 [Vineibacter sp.]|nr:hypothetical protein [Vineibacter sp.]